MTILYIILALAALFIIVMYNGLVVARQRVREGASDIDTQLKRRYDLIPNLVETVKGYAKHEQETLERVVRARNAAMNTQGLNEAKSEAENALSQTLKSIFALSESYPQLQANQNFLELQREISDTENKIQAARRFYNTTVLSLNTKIETFPGNIIAGIFRFGAGNFGDRSYADGSCGRTVYRCSHFQDGQCRRGLSV